MASLNKKPNFFLAGWPKTGSTWLYHCFKEHPDIFVPERDTVHFFSVNYFRGYDWYYPFFKKAGNEKVIADLTPNYVLELNSAKRIYEFNSDAKILFTLRNPVDRAFSQYWHQKKKGQILFNFEDTLHYNSLGNFEMFMIWLRTGFFPEFLKPYFNIFPSSQLKVMFYDDLQTNSKEFLKEVFEFAGVNTTFVPSVMDNKINTGEKVKSQHKSNINSSDINQNTSMQSKLKKKVKKLLFEDNAKNNNKTFDNGSEKTEYEQGIDPEFRKELIELYKPHIIELEEFLQVDLSKWKS